MDNTVDNLINVATQFAPAGTVAQVEPCGAGNINDTYLVRLGTGDTGGLQGGADKFILQRINQSVFQRPHLIMVNLRAMMDHLAAKTSSASQDRRWELPQVLSTHEGEDYFVDDDAGFWRALSFIEGATGYLEVKDVQHAAEAGYALGRFQYEISDLDVNKLHDTLPGFHIIPDYLRHYDEVVNAYDVAGASPEVRYGMEAIASRRTWAPVLETACSAGELQQRPIHGDPKIDNIMIDDVTGKAVSIIDLDTVKPGLVQYDIGDCLRSCCNPLGEHTREIDKVRFEVDLCEAILQGYLPQVDCFFTDCDYAYLFDSVRVLAFEMGLRFFTDYLEGDVYFKTRYPEHNLMRALVQFKLMESIEAQEHAIRQMIRSLTKA